MLQAERNHNKNYEMSNSKKNYSLILSFHKNVLIKSKLSIIIWISEIWLNVNLGQ